MLHFFLFTHFFPFSPPLTLSSGRSRQPDNGATSELASLSVNRFYYFFIRSATSMETGGKTFPHICVETRFKIFLYDIFNCKELKIVMLCQMMIEISHSLDVIVFDW